MDAYEKLTDSILDRIICSTDENLKKSKEILMKVKRRQLYKCVGQTVLEEVRIWKRKPEKNVYRICEKRDSETDSINLIDIKITNVS